MNVQDSTNEAEWASLGNWTGPKWLSVYFSKRDTRLWVPKQIPALGWTVNLGRPGGLAWLLVVLLGLPLFTLAVCLLAMRP